MYRGAWYYTWVLTWVYGDVQGVWCYTWMYGDVQGCMVMYRGIL